MRALRWLWYVIPLRWGILLAPLAFLLGTLIGGAVRL